MALTRLPVANTLSGTIASTNIANASLNAVTALPGAIATGKVLQVLTYTDNTQRSSTSSSFVNCSTTLSGAITPSATSSKILITTNFNGQVPQASTTDTYTIYRDTTNLGDATNGMGSCNDSQIKTIHAHWLDSPSTTSAVAYTAKYRTINGSYTTYFNAGTSPGRGGAKQMAPNYGSFTAIEIGA